MVRKDVVDNVIELIKKQHNLSVFIIIRSSTCIVRTASFYAKTYKPYE